MNLENLNIQNVGVVGAGAMGGGIAQVAALAGCQVTIFDAHVSALTACSNHMTEMLKKLEAKGKIESAKEILSRIVFASQMNSLAESDLIIEAIVEDLEVKKNVFLAIEKLVDDQCILASNTSSLSIASIASACQKPERVIGIHFFNPAPLMALVEIIPAIQTCPSLSQKVKEVLLSWKKTPVIAKDTPGFIVNRVARPFYGEALRIYEEGIADIPTIDWAMTEIGGFKMGPFTLMDYIGHDVNYVVTETVFKSFYYDPRYKPSLIQKRLLEAGWLGRKSGKGFYDYSEKAESPVVVKDEALGKEIVNRIVCMLINEAADALYLKIASKEDIELAMTKGVNYPKGLLHWSDEIGSDLVLATLDQLYQTYHEDRYRASIQLRKMGSRNLHFSSTE